MIGTSCVGKKNGAEDGNDSDESETEECESDCEFFRKSKKRKSKCRGDYSDDDKMPKCRQYDDILSSSGSESESDTGENTRRCIRRLMRGAALGDISAVHDALVFVIKSARDEFRRRFPENDFDFGGNNDLSDREE